MAGHSRADLMGEPGISYHVDCILGLLGVDRANDNFLETPKRVAKSLTEMCAGMRDTDDKITAIMSKKFPSDYDEMIVVTGIQTTGICPHHLLPIEYSIVIGYIPGTDGSVVGLSKLPRLAELLSARLVLQEQLTVDIVHALNEHLSPKGSGVIVEGKHGCMRCRGIEMRSTSAITAKLTGCFLESSTVRQEFLAYYQNGRQAG